MKQHVEHVDATTYLLDNIKEAVFTSLYEIENEARDIWRQFEGVEYQRNLLLQPLFIVESLRVLRYQGLDGSCKNYKEESGIFFIFNGRRR